MNSGHVFLVAFFYLSSVRGDEYNQQTSLCSQFTYGCSYTTYYSERQTHSRDTCQKFILNWSCTQVYWSTYVRRSRLQCRACNVDCQVNNWGNWGACGGTCHDTTIRWRYRSVWRNKYGNGASCPSTSESQRCYIDSKACLIGGVCYAHLDRQSSTGNGGCQECNRLVSRSAWTAVSGGPCDDTQACTKDDQCKNGVCIGSAFTCKSCETCNGAGCTLNSGYCLINSQCYSRDAKNPESQYSQCQACKPDQSTIQWTPLTGDSCNDNDLCTHTDKCTSA
ncbi:uncharacterized protein [Oscarella lobularis]|uniref:uncharacterized protein n=1 Tax=Oscarella lobularis TaxID=121494 RepID=UPI0033131377